LKNDAFVNKAWFFKKEKCTYGRQSTLFLLTSYEKQERMKKDETD